MLSTAEEAGATLEIGKIIERTLQAGVSAGMEDTDRSAFYEITRRESGLD